MTPTPEQPPHDEKNCAVCQRRKKLLESSTNRKEKKHSSGWKACPSQSDELPLLGDD